MTQSPQFTPMGLYPETLEVRQMESIWEPEPVSGSHMGTALLLILFSPSASENSASFWDEGPDSRMPVQPTNDSAGSALPWDGDQVSIPRHCSFLPFPRVVKG